MRILGGKKVNTGQRERLQLSGRMDERLRRAFPVLQFVADALAWAIAVPVATWLRYDLRIRPIDVAGVMIVTGVAICAQGAIGFGFGLYRRRYHYGSLDEVRVLGISMAAVALATGVVSQSVDETWVPRSVPVLAGLLALVLAMVVRFSARLIEERRLGPSPERSEPVIVFGAGASGAQIVKSQM